jgi:hypothetical protein
LDNLVIDIKIITSSVKRGLFHALLRLNRKIRTAFV